MNSSQPNLSSLPESDVELLSAYLDNQLGVAERVNLERRLEAEPALRAELAELREAVGAVRALEPVRPPRSFTLDP
ncbi:MAG TPA: anti-sigma factor, partial [Chloroflexaceae bacterium]|nr:anti-sigma factor [Chloroflexaceae bacterium]